ncbi:hypothetical protein LLG88_05990, partial [bacterium]|nr:hypothetical protein [bacterium]
WDEAARYAAARRDAMREFGAMSFFRGAGAFVGLPAGHAATAAGPWTAPERDEVALASDWLAVGAFLGAAIEEARASRMSVFGR